MTAHRSGNGWTICACGSRHWGRYGAAGLFLWRVDGGGIECLLHHRSAVTHHGGTWSIPAGAIDRGESPLAAALREAHEEVGIAPSSIRAHDTHTLTHPNWRFTTVVAQSVGSFEPSTTNAETLDARWVPLELLRHYPLLPAFADAMLTLTQMVRTEKARSRIVGAR